MKKKQKSLTKKDGSASLAVTASSQIRTPDDIRNTAWFKLMSETLGTMQLTHAVAKIEAMQKACSVAADWIEQCPFENALPHAKHLRSFANNPHEPRP